MWFIYVITNIEQGSYIGATRNIRRRMKEHKNSLGFMPVYEILENGHTDNWRPAEHRWIERYRAEGKPLINKTVGRNGNQSLSEESRRKLSAALRGRPKPPGFGARVSAAQKGKAKNVAPEAAARMAVTQFKAGERRSAAERRRMSRDLRKRWRSIDPVTRSAMSTARNHGAWAKRSAEERSAIGRTIAATRRRNHTPEQLSAIARRNAQIRMRDPRARRYVGNRIRAWWASLSPAEKRQQIELRQRSRAARAEI